MAMTVNDRELHLEAWELDLVLSILNNYIPEFEVVVFGSRAGGRPDKFSDLDLAIMTDQPLGFARIADLKEAFNESDIVFKVDLVDWATTSDRFREIIRTSGFIIKKQQKNLTRQ